MCAHGTSVVVPTPDWFWDSRSFPENGIAIDACIVGDVLNAWKHGIYTGGSCCGHGTQRPNVVLLEEAHIDGARTLLPGFDIFLWRLVAVSSPLENAIGAIDVVLNEHVDAIFQNDMTTFLDARERFRNMQSCGLR